MRTRRSVAPKTIHQPRLDGLAFMSGKWKNVSGVVRYKPSIDFAETRLETSFSFNHEISETVSLGITTQGVLDSQSIADSDLHASYLIQFTYTPE